MQAKKQKITALLCALFVTAGFLHTQTAFGASVQDKINAAAQKQKEALAEKNAAQQQMKGAMAEITNMDKELDALTLEISAIDDVIAEAEEKIAEKEAEIKEYEAQIEESDDAFRARLRAMDETNAGGYIDLLFNSKSISDFVANLETIREITAFDQGVINHMIALKNGVEESKNAIVAERDAQKEARNILDDKQKALNAKVAQKEAYMKQLENDVKKYDAIYSQAKAEEERLKQSLSSSLSKGNTSSGQIKYSGGVFCWPAPSYTYISSEWGYRIHPVYKTQKYHSGMDLAAPGGSPILAAADGTVKFSGWNGGYGYCVIVDHGGGLQTLYAHSSKLLVSVGQSVTKGQKIALVGTTGTSTGNHLHFEVLNNGKSVNPRPYLGI